MNGRGYFNFRFHWRADTNWGIGYLAIQRLERMGNAKNPVGPVIVLLNAKADHSNTPDRAGGATQSRLGAIYDTPNGIDTGTSGSIKGEDRSFNDWQRNWLGLRDPATGWQTNINPSGTLDPNQPVYRSGKGYYNGRTTPWTTSHADTAANREYSAHRAVNNPGRLYTTGVIYKAPASSAITADPYVFDKKYADLGAGFETGEYRVYLRKGYDSLYKTAGVGDARQLKMYRYYEASFDIFIYPGVVTTAVYRDVLKSTEGSFAYTPIPQAAYGRLVVINNPSNASDANTVNAILLDKAGYQSSMSYSLLHEVQRYQAAVSTTPTNMAAYPTNLAYGSKWGLMAPLNRGQMHTFILPPGGYRIGVRKSGDAQWYGASAAQWFPVIVGEGETVYLSFLGAKLSR
ncbi:MAG: hypothetical protein LBI91_07435, partial [Spirochaetaceae bacterium]|jgi:hypothetical protein|nr:hypothetical protein [Spirochaetaceae bacterium]